MSAKNAKLQQEASPLHARFGLPICVENDRMKLIDSMSVFDAITFHTNSADESSGRL
jgi:hypothetical protein